MGLGIAKKQWCVEDFAFLCLFWLSNYGRLLMVAPQYGPTVLVVEDFDGVEATILMDYTDCGDLIRRPLMVNRGYALMVYNIIGMAKNFSMFWHDVYDGLNSTWNLVCEKLCGVDVECYSITLS